jgi:hypothetical protein
MSTDTFYARVDNKSHVFIRTESRFFDITDDEVPDRDGLVPDAILVSNETVAELVAKLARAKVRRSKITRFSKEAAV